MELARQDFSGTVGNVAARDIVNNHHHTHGRPLTKQERVELNKAVQRLEAEFGEPSWQTWKFLHRTIGIESIEGMCLGHRDQAEAILQLLIDRATYRKTLEERSKKSQQSEENTTLKRHNNELAERLAHLQKAYALLEKRSATNAQKADETTTLSRRNGELTDHLAKLQKSYSAIEMRLARSNSLVSSTNQTAKKLSRTRWLLALSFAAIGAIAYWSSTLNTRLKAARADDLVCRMDGRTYAIGEVVDQRNAPDLQCAVGGINHQAEWQQVKVPVQKKSPQPRRSIVQEPAAAASAVAPINTYR
jgi:hypothetical protein